MFIFRQIFDFRLYPLKGGSSRALAQLVIFLWCQNAIASSPSKNSNDTSFDRYYPKAEYPSYQELYEETELAKPQSDNLVGGIKNLSQEITKGFKKVAQKRNMTCLNDPCLLQFFPLAYNRRNSGFFGGMRINLTNISEKNPYFYTAHLQVTRSDTEQWLGSAYFDVPKIKFRHFTPRLKLRAHYFRSTEFRYTGVGSESYTLYKFEDEAKRYSHNQTGAGSTILIPLFNKTDSLFGIYTSLDSMHVKNQPFIESTSILFGQKPVAYQGGQFQKLGFGIYFDTRDNEYLTRHGQFFELGYGIGKLKYSKDWVQRAGMIDRRYFSSGRWTLAHRLTMDVLFGASPFWEDSSVGGIDPIRDVSGSGILKGYSGGRFHEKFKLIESFELRVQQNDFKALGLNGSLVLVPIAVDLALMGYMGAWSTSMGLDAMWNKSFLTRFYMSYAEKDYSVNLKFNYEF